MIIVMTTTAKTVVLLSPSHTLCLSLSDIGVCVWTNRYHTHTHRDRDGGERALCRITKQRLRRCRPDFEQQQQQQLHRVASHKMWLKKKEGAREREKQERDWEAEVENKNQKPKNQRWATHTIYFFNFLIFIPPFFWKLKAKRKWLLPDVESSSAKEHSNNNNTKRNKKQSRRSRRNTNRDDFMRSNRNWLFLIFFYNLIFFLCRNHNKNLKLFWNKHLNIPHTQADIHTQRDTHTLAVILSNLAYFH